MDTQALSIACQHFKDEGSLVVADLKKQLADLRKENNRLRKWCEQLEQNDRSSQLTYDDLDRQHKKARIELISIAAFLNELAVQCRERREDVLRRNNITFF